MGRRGDGPRAAQAQVGEDLQVLAGQHFDVAVGDQRQGGLEVATAVLDRGDARMADDAPQGLALDAHAGAVGNVVEHQRHAGGVGHGLEERLQALLRRADVVRRRHQQASHGAALDFLLEGQQLAQIVAGQAHDHLLLRHPLQHGVEHRQLLLMAERGGLAGGAADHEAGDAVLQQPAHQAAQGGEVDFPGTQGRGQGHPDPTKRRHAKTPCS